MSQINIKRTGTFTPPASGSLGFGFDELGNPCRINEDGTKTIIPINNDDETVPGLTSNVIANLGVGLESAIPIEFSIGDVYATTDTLKIYTAIDSTSWTAVDLAKGQFVTSGVEVYQYNGVTLFPLNASVINNRPLADNGVTLIPVGSSIIYKSLFFQYHITRASVNELGYIAITNEDNGADGVQVTQFLASTGFSISKDITDTIISLVITDTLSNGIDGTISLEINKFLI